MRVFSCGNCGQAVYFENVICENCDTALGFDPAGLTMKPLYPAGDGKLATKAGRGGRQVYCANYSHDVCNWLVAEKESGSLCLSCGLSRTIPDLSVPGNPERWFEFEKAKRRLIYELLKLGLPVKQAGENNGVPSLAFDILADTKTGHENGVITLNVAEADPAVRERTREQFGEPYRTLLGHFRHESGHYYWLALIANGPALKRFRELFGDESADYAKALAAYHQRGPKSDWAQNFISAYATAHPWEDWAESWAHYLHMVDTLETAADYRLDPRLPYGKSASRAWFESPNGDPYRASSAMKLVDRWIPLALAINSLNRSMGLSDFYPFIVSPRAAEKLDFVHQVIRSARGV
ncbi:MAG: putative zinc-binding peptidase [Rhodomicrobiaceae bacterium]